MSTAFTPGPWTSYPSSLERYSQVITAKGAMVQVAYTSLNHHDQIAMTKEVYGDRMTYGPGEETTANAQLIAAAPELLAALQWFVENDDTNIGQPGNEFWEAGLNCGIAAIAKATGVSA